MASDVRPASDQSVTALVSGIVNDAQDLLKQQVALFRSEIRDDLNKTKRAGTVLGVGVGVGLLGVLLVGHMLALLLEWATDIPLWGSYGIVGGVLLLTSGALIYMAREQFASFNPLPEKSVQALEENLQWKTATPK